MAESQLLAPIARNALTDEIVKRLMAYIVEAGLRPGDRLPSERELQATFAVGRSSMREALRTIAAFGLVEVRPGSGIFVGSGEPAELTRGLPWGLLLSDHSARELMEARRVVEPELAAFAAERGTESELAAIGKQAEQMRGNLDDVERYIAANLDFHIAIARAAHNRVLGHVFDSLGYLVRVLTRRTFAPLSLREHEKICEAIVARDTAAARTAMTEHLVTTSRMARALSLIDLNAERQTTNEVQ